MVNKLLLLLVFFVPTWALAATAPSPQDTQLQLKTIDDLKDKKIGVLLGSAHDSYATKHFPNAQILQFKSPADVLLAVKTSKVDAALYDAEPLREVFRQDDTLALLGESLFSFDVGVGFSKNNQALKQQFDSFLSQIKANGVYDDMVKRWMTNGETDMPAINAPTKNGILKVGVSDAGLPFTIVKDNQLVGFDIELAQRFAAAQGKEIQFLNMEFGSLIAAVSSGKADMIASAIYVTDERKKQIAFSQPYFEMATRVFTLKQNVAVTPQTGAEKSGTENPSHLLSTLADLKD
ncbi:MAG: transporter substrate-binding domain-containing protein, partial [Methylotenera sp.]